MWIYVEFVNLSSVFLDTPNLHSTTNSIEVVQRHYAVARRSDYGRIQFAMGPSHGSYIELIIEGR